MDPVYLIVITVICVIIGCYMFTLIQGNRRVDDIHKKAVFVTGCDSGFGRLLCTQLDALGCPVFAGCFTQEGADQLKSQTSSTLQTLLLDVRSSESIENAQKFISENLPTGAALWGLVNNAGVATFGLPVEFLKIENYKEMMQVNYLGPVELVLTFLNMLAHSKGRIVNTSSMIAKMPIPFAGAYAGSKFAIHGFSESLRREKESWGIKVCTLFPGQFYTGITDPAHVETQIQNYWDKQPAHIKANYNENQMKSVLEGYANIINNYGNRNLSLVTDHMIHALFSRRPRANYYSGWDAKIFPILESLPFGIFPKMQAHAWTYGKILNDYITKRAQNT